LLCYFLVMIDIDECEDVEDLEPECADECINTIGSYECRKRQRAAESLICPDDVVTELGPGEHAVQIEMEKPITNLDFNK